MALYTHPFVTAQKSSVSVTFSGNNTTESETLFTIDGSVYIVGIWGVVTAVIGANHTAGYLQLEDGAQTDLTASSGVTLSGLAAGTLVTKTGLAAAALTLDNNVGAKITEPASAGQNILSPIIVVKKAGVVTTVKYTYTTTDTPTSGSMQWFVAWEPLSADGTLT